MICGFTGMYLHPDGNVVLQGTRKRKRKRVNGVRPTTIERGQL